MQRSSLNIGGKILTVTHELMKEFAVWTEVGKAERDDYFVKGLTEWAKVTSLAYILAPRKRLEVDSPFPLLMKHKPPHMQIVGGIKIRDYFEGCKPFDSNTWDFSAPEPWQVIAKHARYLAGGTGVNVVGLDQETATHPFHAHGASIDYDRLQDSLGVLADTGIRYTLYVPFVNYNTGDFPDREEETTRFVKAVREALPTAKFRCNYTGFPLWKGHRLVEPYRNAMMDLVGVKNMEETLYTTISDDVDPRYHYTPPQALAMIRDVLPPENLNIIWPGGREFLSVAEAFVELLPPLTAGVE
jgi:hypothetical protein